MEVVFLQVQRHEVTLGRVEQPPPLHLTRVHGEVRVQHAVDRVQGVGPREERLIRFRERDGVEELVVVTQLDRLQHHHPFPRRADLPDPVDLAADDEHPGHPGPELLGHPAVPVRVVPAEAARVILRQRDLETVILAGRDIDEHVVRVTGRRDVQPMGVQVGVRPLVRPVHHHVLGRPHVRQPVAQVDLQGVAGVDLPGVPGHDLVPGVGLDQLRRAHVHDGGHRGEPDIQHAVRAALHPWLRQHPRPACRSPGRRPGLRGRRARGLPLEDSGRQGRACSTEPVPHHAAARYRTRHRFSLLSVNAEGNLTTTQSNKRQDASGRAAHTASPCISLTRATTPGTPAGLAGRVVAPITCGQLALATQSLN